MKSFLRNHASAVLAMAGLGAILAAFAWDLLRGQPLILGWLQFLLILFGGLALLVSLPPVLRGFRAALAHSIAQTPATQTMIRRRPHLYLLYSVWFGLVAGFGEAAYEAYQKSFLNPTIFHYNVQLPGMHFMWGTPLGYTLLLLVCGLLVYALARVWPGHAFFGGAIFVFSLVGLSGWLLALRGLHWLAAIVLAGGLAVQWSRLTLKHTYLFHRVALRSGLLLGAMVPVLAGGLIGWQHFHEQRTLSVLPQPQPAAPNVLLIVLDTVRAKSMSLYGYERATTPALDSLARQGVVFERAISTAPWTLPSHGSMFTGRFPHEMTAAWLTPLDATYPTLAEAFSEQGYATAGFIANTTYCRADFGLARGFIHYEDHRVTLGRIIENTNLGRKFINGLGLRKDTYDRKTAAHVNHDFLSWLSKRDQDRPFFVFLNYFDAHGPYLPPDSFAHAFSLKTPRGMIDDKPIEEWSEEDVRELNDAYDGALAYLDHQLGLLFEDLERRGVLDNTLVIVTADHGEQFGEHGLLFHTNSLYMPLLHVPLLIRFPARIPAGRHIDAFVSLRDLPATLVDLADFPDTTRFPGKSLSTYWTAASDSTLPPAVPLLAEVDRTARRAFPESDPASKGAMKSLIFEGIHYIKNYGDGREELYDIVRDPEEEQDLSATDHGLLKQYRAYLKEAVKGTRHQKP